MESANILADEESDELIGIARQMLEIMQERVEIFCRVHARADPREADLLLIIITELLVDGMLITTVPEERRVEVLQKMSRNVLKVLRARAEDEVRGHA